MRKSKSKDNNSSLITFFKKNKQQRESKQLNKDKVTPQIANEVPQLPNNGDLQQNTIAPQNPNNPATYFLSPDASISKYNQEELEETFCNIENTGDPLIVQQLHLLKGVRGLDFMLGKDATNENRPYIPTPYEDEKKIPKDPTKKKWYNKKLEIEENRQVLKKFASGTVIENKAAAKPQLTKVDAEKPKSTEEFAVDTISVTP